METSNPLLKRDESFSGYGIESMRLEGVINKTGILLALCAGAGTYSWTHPSLQGPMIIGGALGGLILCLISIFKPSTTPVTAPLYSILEGLCLAGTMQLNMHK